MLLLIQIIQVNLTQENPQQLVAGKSLDMTYSVTWSETTIPFARRFEAYLDYPFFEHQVSLATSLFLACQAKALVFDFGNVLKGETMSKKNSRFMMAPDFRAWDGFCVLKI